MFTYDTVANNPFKTVAALLRLRLRGSGKSKGVRSMWSTQAWLRPTGWLIPIRKLNSRHRGRLEEHLLELEPSDRYLRFGYAASNEQIHRYVAGIDFRRDDVFGIYNRKLQLVAMAHLARSTDEGHRACAEFGVSVGKPAREKGYGSRLFERAVMHARNHGVQLLFVHALSENKAMLSIARKAGATVERDGSESNAYLKLPPPDMEGMVQEMVDEQLAQTDYWLKTQASGFRQWLEKLQERRMHTPGDDDKSA
jgi:RimJ/RimL family protein N-acetyltransferase